MNRIAAFAAILIATLTLTACNEVTVDWFPEALHEDAIANQACRIEVEPQPSASIHFRLLDCRTGTEALLQISGHQTRVRSTYIWTPSPRRIEHQYWVYAQIVDGRSGLELPIRGNRDFLGMLIYNW